MRKKIARTALIFGMNCLLFSLNTFIAQASESSDTLYRYADYIRLHDYSDYLGNSELYPTIGPQSETPIHGYSIADYDADGILELCIIGGAASGNALIGILDVVNGETLCIYSEWGTIYGRYHDEENDEEVLMILEGNGVDGDYHFCWSGFDENWQKTVYYEEYSTFENDEQYYWNRDRIRISVDEAMQMEKSIRQSIIPVFIYYSAEGMSWTKEDLAEELDRLAYDAKENDPMRYGYEKTYQNYGLKDTGFHSFYELFSSGYQLEMNTNHQKITPQYYYLFDFDQDQEEEMLLYAIDDIYAYHWEILDQRNGSIWRIAKDPLQKPGNAGHSLSLIDGRILIDHSRKSLVGYEATWNAFIYFDSGDVNYLYDFLYVSYNNSTAASDNETSQDTRRNFWFNAEEISEQEYLNLSQGTASGEEVITPLYDAGEREWNIDGIKWLAEQEHITIQEENINNFSRNEYILPYSDREVIGWEDVEGFSLQKLNYARNEIYARHGRKFLSQELTDYFNSKSWYHGEIEPENFNNDWLNPTEKQNVEFLYSLEYRDGVGYLLDQGR